MWGLAMAFLGATIGCAQTVTLEGRAMRVGPLLEAIQDQTGKKLRAGNVREEVLYLHVHQRSLEEVRRVLAETIEADWTREGDTLVLQRTPAREAESRRAFVKARADSIRKSLDSASSALDAPFDLAVAEGLARRWKTMAGLAERAAYEGDMGASRESLKHLVPGRRLLLRAMRRLGPERLAAIEWGERIVLVANPNLRQTKLDADLIAQYQREQNVWADAVERVGAPKDGDGMNVDDPFANTRRIDQVPSDVTVIVKEAFGDLPFRGQLFVGGTIASDYLPFVFGERRRTLMPVESERFALEPVESEFLRRLREVRYPGGFAHPLSPELRKILTDPVEHEPTGLVLDAFFQADAGDASVIALVSDMEALTACAYGGEQPTPRSVARAFEIAGVTREASDGWVRWRSKSGYLARTERIGRTVLRDVVRFALDQGELDLIGWAELWYRAPATSHGTEFAANLLAVAVGRVVDEHEIGRPMHLRFYGSLSAEQRRNLRDGRSLLGASLSPAQLREFERVLYSDQILSRTRPPTGATAGADPRAGIAAEIEEATWMGPFAGLVEPTAAFPNGAPKDLTITLARRDFPRLWVYPSPNAPADWDGVSASNFGHNVGHASPQEATKPKYFRVGASRVHLLMIEYPSQGIGHDLTLKDKKVDARSELLQEADLPAELRKAIAEARDRAIAAVARQRDAKRNDPPSS